MPRTALPKPAAAVAATGYLGVGVFFVLSGFILTYVYGLAAEDGTLVRRDFWRARLARIYPAYAAALVFTIPLLVRNLLVAPGPSGATLLGIAATTISLTQAWIPGWGVWWNTPGWSLSAEVFFYLVFPLLAPWVLRRGLRASIVLGLSCAGVTAALGLLLDGAAGGDAGRLSVAMLGWITAWTPMVRLPEFVLGMFAGHLYLRGVRLPQIAGTLAAAALVGVAMSTSTKSGSVARLAAVGLCIAVFIGARASSTARGVLGAPWMVRLGNASYALYLFHGTTHSYFLAVANRTLGREWAQGYTAFFVYTLIAAGIALLVHDRLELPARRFLRGGPRGAVPRPFW